jgi:hypothetical protein
MPDWKTRHSTKLFAEKVMPHLRGLWPEWHHDERWWCHPMEERLRLTGGPTGAPPGGNGGTNGRDLATPPAAREARPR